MVFGTIIIVVFIKWPFQHQHHNMNVISITSWGRNWAYKIKIKILTWTCLYSTSLSKRSFRFLIQFPDSQQHFCAMFMFSVSEIGSNLVGEWLFVARLLFGAFLQVLLCSNCCLVLTDPAIAWDLRLDMVSSSKYSLFSFKKI